MKRFYFKVSIGFFLFLLFLRLFEKPLRRPFYSRFGRGFSLLLPKNRPG